MDNVFEQLKTFFIEKEWVYTAVEEENLIVLGIHGENGRFHCIADVIADTQQLLFYSICDVNVPETKRLAMSELLMRANANKVLGNFEMNFDDGEIRYKTSIDYEGIEAVTLRLIEDLIMANLTMMDTFLPAIMKLIDDDDITPLQALQFVEE